MNAKQPSRLLDGLMIAAPCSQSWDAMEGTSRVRFCRTCSKSVYNVSDMTNSQAEDFLREKGVSECVRFYRRTDGTIITDNCPVGLRAARNAWRRVTRFAAGFAALLMGTPGAAGQSDPSRGDPPPAVTVRGDSAVFGGEPTYTPPTYIAPAIGGKPHAPWPDANETAPPISGTVSSPPPQKHQSLSDASKKAGAVKLHASVNADSKAMNFYRQAQLNEQLHKHLVAISYYKQALNSLNPRTADPKFRELIEKDLRNLERKILN